MSLARSIFAAGLVVFVLWYLVAYLVTTGTTTDSLSAAAFAATAVFSGLATGAVLAAGAHAIDLALTHNSVHSGESRDGASVTLGKLPVALRTGPAVAVSGVGEAATVTVADRQSDGDAEAKTEAIESEADASEPNDPVEPDAPVPDADNLIGACAAFAKSHAAVTIDGQADGAAGCVGIIDRSAAPEAFAAFLDVIERLADSHVDTSRIVVSAGVDGVPTEVRFPLG